MQYRLSTLMLAVLTVAFALSGWQFGAWLIQQPGAPSELHDLLTFESTDFHLLATQFGKPTPATRGLLGVMVTVCAALPLAVLLVGGRRTLLPMAIAFVVAIVAYCLVLNPRDLVATHPRAILNSTPWLALFGGWSLFYIPDVNRRSLLLLLPLIAITFAWYAAVLFNQFPRF